MASLAIKVKLYCEANSKTVDFTKDVLLQNDSDGKGDYIKEWNVSGLDKPTDEQLATYETAGNTEETNSSGVFKKLISSAAHKPTNLFLEKSPVKSHLSIFLVQIPPNS